MKAGIAMIKTIIFFIFSLIMLKISRAYQEIQEALQPSTDITDSLNTEQSMDEERSNPSIFQRFMALLRSLPPLAIAIRDILLSKTHGLKFYRFFAFEFVFLLILINFGEWLKNPFTVFRLITWMVLCGSFVLAGYSIYHLLLFGKPQLSDDTEIPPKLTLSEIYKYICRPIYTSKIILSISTTTNLVTSGVYKYIRHPLYCSLIILCAATLIKRPSIKAAILFSIATVFIYATARAEEKENLIKFGDDYAVYMEKTKMFFSVFIFGKILNEE